jgi:hypothetical protein
MSVRAASGVAPIRGGQSPKPLARPKPGHLSFVPEARRSVVGREPAQPVFDVLGFSAAFPDKWMGYLRANFDDAVHVARTFRVSERAARKWWDGVGAARGDKVLIAMRIHPEASQMLLAA